MFADPMWRVCCRKLSFFRIVTPQFHTSVPRVAALTGCQLVEGLALHVEVCLFAAVIKPLLVVSSAQPGASFKWWCLTVSCIIRWWYLIVPLCYQIVVFGSVLCLRWWYLTVSLCYQMVISVIVSSVGVIVSPDGGVWQCHCVIRWWCLTVSLCHHEDVIWQCHCVTMKMLSDTVTVSPDGGAYVTVLSFGVRQCDCVTNWECHYVNKWCLTVSLCHQMVSDGIIVSQNDVV